LHDVFNKLRNVRVRVGVRKLGLGLRHEVNLNANKAAGLDYLSLIEFNPENFTSISIYSEELGSGLGLEGQG
jgi:hypothetical protein